VAGTRSGPCPMADFRVSNVESLGYVTTVLISTF
jgi:hypothetical protein